MIIEEVKRLSNLYENKIPSALLFETLFKAEELHKQEIIDAHGVKKIYTDEVYPTIINGEQYYQETFKKD
jgi:hypothetical protein